MMLLMDIVNLKNLMKKHGMTQTQLANLLGRDKAVVTNLMQGRRALKAEEAVTIARHLGVDVAQLLGEKPSASGRISEPESLIPFRQPPSKARRSSQVVERHGKHFLKDHGTLATGKTYALEVKDDSLNLLGVMQGDIVIAEMDSPCRKGQIVVAQHYKGAGAETVIRKYEPPFLVAHSTGGGYTPLREDDEQVRLVSPVVKLIRLF